MAHLSRVGSVFTTLSISIQHFIVLKCYSKERKIGGLLLPISWATAIIFNIPKFYEFKTTPTLLVEVGKNGTIIPLVEISNATDFLPMDRKDYTFHETYTDELRKNSIYVLLYLFWARLILIELIPYILTITINVVVRQRLSNLSQSSNRDLDDGTLLEFLSLIIAFFLSYII